MSSTNYVLVAGIRLYALDLWVVAVCRRAAPALRARRAACCDLLHPGAGGVDQPPRPPESSALLRSFPPPRPGPRAPGRPRPPSTWSARLAVRIPRLREGRPRRRARGEAPRRAARSWPCSRACSALSIASCMPKEAPARSATRTSGRASCSGCHRFHPTARLRLGAGRALRPDPRCQVPPRPVRHPGDAALRSSRNDRGCVRAGRGDPSGCRNRRSPDMRDLTGPGTLFPTHRAAASGRGPPGRQQPLGTSRTATASWSPVGTPMPPLPAGQRAPVRPCAGPARARTAFGCIGLLLLAILCRPRPDRCADSTVRSRRRPGGGGDRGCVARSALRRRRPRGPPRPPPTRSSHCAPGSPERRRCPRQQGGMARMTVSVPPQRSATKPWAAPAGGMWARSGW